MTSEEISKLKFDKLYLLKNVNNWNIETYCIGACRRSFSQNGNYFAIKWADGINKQTCYISYGIDLELLCELHYQDFEEIKNLRMSDIINNYPEYFI